jgi:hypothetical protein
MIHSLPGAAPVRQWELREFRDDIRQEIPPPAAR